MDGTFIPKNDIFFSFHLNNLIPLHDEDFNYNKKNWCAEFVAIDEANTISQILIILNNYYYN